MQPKEIISAIVFAQRMGLTVGAVTKGARDGRSGQAGFKERREWKFAWPEARDEWLTRTDHSRSTAEVVRRAEAARPRGEPLAPPADPLVDDLGLQIKARLDELQARVLAASGFDSEDRADIADVFGLARTHWAGVAPQPDTLVDYSGGAS
jgi:hypothetical protein